MDHSKHEGAWVRLGRVTATHAADHDTIRVEGRNDDFRKLKFTVTDAPLNMHRTVVTYDNGTAQSLEVRQDISKGGETRDIEPAGRQSPHPHHGVLVRHQGPAQRQGGCDGIWKAMTPRWLS
jgi:hypothetical protein